MPPIPMPPIPGMPPGLALSPSSTRSATIAAVVSTRPATEATPILALGANASPEAIVKALEAGFFQVLAKPLRAKPFMEALAFALEFAAVERSEQNALTLRFGRPRIPKEPR